jgi:molybdenum-dependent DNA-binding transcriptional regulator ModE
MTATGHSTRRKLSLLQLAEELGNVSKACKLMGYHRDTFYEVKRAFQIGGGATLVEQKRGPRKGTDATVRDLISACANAKGGVHLGKARTESEQRLLDWDEVFSVIGTEPSLAALAGICRVTLLGLLFCVE